VTKCEYCEIIENESQVIASSDAVVIAVRDKVTTPGQITVFPREHFTILEMVPEDILQQCMLLANKVSIAIFENLGSQGTNIVIRNGLGAGQDVPHFGIEIIPRREEDGLNLHWEPRQLSEDEIEITQQIFFEAINETQKDVKQDRDKFKEKSVKETKDKKNYLIKSLRRRA
jgi:diadenosine tetraphosphate (Ap4A) HIT family hydrolase